MVEGGGPSQSILESNVRSSVGQLKLEQSWIVQQANKPKQSSRYITVWLKKKRVNLTAVVGRYVKILNPYFVFHRTA